MRLTFLLEPMFILVLPRRSFVFGDKYEFGFYDGVNVASKHNVILVNINCTWLAVCACGWRKCWVPRQVSRCGRRCCRCVAR